MNLLPSLASYPSNIADLFTKPFSLTRHRFTTTSLIGDLHSPNPTTSVTSTGDSATVVATVTVVAPPTSESVPAAPSLPIVLDTGASFARPSDFSLEVTQASYGLFRSPISVVTKALASTPVDPYTLITGEDVSVDLVDLSSPDITTIVIDSDFDSDSGPSLGPSFIKVHFDVRQFGTASLTFIFSPNWSLIKVFVTPTQVDWIHWVPLPRLTPTESYFHISGLDYLQAFTLFHLIPIWIYLLHSAINLD